MKLVNPVGRDVSTFSTQANYEDCGCICSAGSTGLRYYGYMRGTCFSNCGSGTANKNANQTKALKKVTH